jgi:hypothetical protein
MSISGEHPLWADASIMAIDPKRFHSPSMNQRPVSRLAMKQHNGDNVGDFRPLTRGAVHEVPECARQAGALAHAICRGRCYRFSTFRHAHSSTLSRPSCWAMRPSLNSRQSSQRGRYLMTGHVRQEIHFADGQPRTAKQRVHHCHVKIEIRHDPVTNVLF